VYPVELDEPTLTPFTYTPYPTTPTLSVDADHDTATDDCVTAPTAKPDGTDGACVSVEPVEAAITVVAAD
jgi:hypothetical protein